MEARVLQWLHIKTKGGPKMAKNAVLWCEGDALPLSIVFGSTAG